MTREQSILEFCSQEKILQEKTESQAWKEILKYEDIIRAFLNNGIRELRKEAEKAGKEKIAYIQFEVLRSELMRKKYTVLLHGYDMQWYMDKEAVLVELNLDELIQDRISEWESLYNKAKKYIGKINLYDIDNIMVSRIVEEFSLVSHALRLMCSDIEENEDYKALNKEEIVYIRFGEYRDHSEILYKFDETEKTPKEFRKEKALIETQSDVMVYSKWTNIKLVDEELTKAKCHYIGFKNAELKNVNFQESKMTFAEFSDCILEKCNFLGCVLTCADFSESTLTDCNFEYADVEDAIFTINQLEFINLDNEQLKTIRVVGLSEEQIKILQQDGELNVENPNTLLNAERGSDNEVL